MENLEKVIFLVIGGGIAGVTCAENLVYLCPNEKIVLITQSKVIKTVTNLVPLAKSLCRFNVEECSFKDLNKNIKVTIDTVDFIDSTQQIVRTKLGNLYKYKYMCLCTGGDPKLIQKNNEFVIGIRDTESVSDFQKRINNSKEIVIVGNGGIASEIIYESKNITINWVIRDSFISSTFLDPGAAEFLQDKLRKNYSNKEGVLKQIRYENAGLSTQFGPALGPDWQRNMEITGALKNSSGTVKIHYETEVSNIEKTLVENDFPLKVTLTNNKVIFCDFVVSATGVNPRINFECDKQFAIGADGGISVDEFQRTNLNFIYAAGDVCFANWNLSDDWFQMRLWTQARQMGAMAGKAMAAALKEESIMQDFCFELFGHVTTLYGFQVVLLGCYNGQNLGTNYEILLRITPDKEYIKFVLQNGKLKGAILIGNTGLEETCENLILNKLDLSLFQEDLLNPNIDIEDYFD